MRAKKEKWERNNPRSGCWHQEEGECASRCQLNRTKNSWAKGQGDEESWQEGDQMTAHWDEEQKLEEFLERRRMEGSTLQLVVYERMSQGNGANGTKEKKKVIGWSTEEMREKPNTSLEEDTEEMCTE